MKGKTMEKLVKKKAGIYSMSRHVSERKACPNCQHFHRALIRRTCGCCFHDWKTGSVDLEADVLLPADE